MGGRSCLFTVDLFVLEESPTQMESLRPTVMKFGGTSVEDASAFERVAQLVAARLELRPVVVVSAMSGVTDALIDCVRSATEGNSETGDFEFERPARATFGGGANAPEIGSGFCGDHPDRERPARLVVASGDGCAR